MRESQQLLARDKYCVPRTPPGEEIHLIGVSTANVAYSDVEGGEVDVFVANNSTLVWGDGNLEVDPKFVDPDGPDDDPDTFGDNNYRLDTGSPAIDAADNNAVTVCSADLDGNERFIDDLATFPTGNPPGEEVLVDMGAYEFDSDPALDCNNNQVADSCCPADADGDGDVGPFDLASLLGAWGDCPDPCTIDEASCSCPADFNSDCEVGAFDLASLLASWGPCP